MDFKCVVKIRQCPKMNFIPYMPRPCEDTKDYYHRLWMSDLWDTVSTMEYDVPNQIIRTIVNMKRYVYSRSLEDLVKMLKNFENDLMKPDLDRRHYEWVKVYCRRLNRRKNMAFRRTYPQRKLISPPTLPAPPPSPLGQGIGFGTRRH